MPKKAPELSFQKHIAACFGLAKGTDKPWSDFDLAVVAPTLTDREFSHLWNAIDDLPLVFKLDLLHWDRLPQERFKEKIRQEGRRFYPLQDQAL